LRNRADAGLDIFRQSLLGLSAGFPLFLTAAAAGIAGGPVSDGRELLVEIATQIIRDVLYDIVTD
jgi:hypothetical protein